MHNLCFNRTELIRIDESECSVYMNTNNMIGLMCAFICHKLQIGIFIFSDMRTLHKYSLSVFAHNNHSLALFLYLF